MERTVIYFEKPGAENTVKTLEAARKRVEELGLNHVIVASTTGFTAFKALKVFEPLKDRVNLIIVTHAGAREYSEKELERIKASWAKVLTCPHTLGWGVGDAFKAKYQGGFTTERIVADALRRFSEGMKVAVEIALMATDAGLIPPGVEAASIAGTGRGADTAVVLVTAYTRDFFRLKICEIIAMPR